MLIVLTIIFAIISIFNPFVGGLAYVIVLGLWEAYLFAMTRTRNDTSMKHRLSTEENEMWNRHMFFVRAPRTAQKLSSGFSFIQIAAIPFAIWLTVTGMYVLAGLVAINLFVANRLAIRLNPLHFYQEAARKGDMDAAHRVEDLAGVVDELQSN